MKMNKAIFLDRDGVINKDKGLIYKIEDVEIFPYVYKALQLLKNKGYKLIVITNQPSVARGLISIDGIREIHNSINKKLNNLIDRFYFCPHHPEKREDIPEFAKIFRIVCKCRKPLSGMILRASKDFNIDLNESYMIGDMVSDIVAGKNAGCKTILIKSKKNKDKIKSNINYDINTKPDFYAKDLLDSAKIIITKD